MMCTNMRIEIIINHSFKSPEGNKKEDNQTLAKSSRKVIETTVPNTFNSPSPRKNYTIKYHSWAQIITKEKFTCCAIFHRMVDPYRKQDLE